MTKKIITYLGILDLIGLIRGYDIITSYIKSSEITFLIILTLLLYLSLLISGVLLIRENRIGLNVYYFQFPFRLMFAIFSFGFLYSLNPLLFDSSSFGFKFLTAFLAVIEIGRLILTIKYHRQLIQLSN